MSRIGQLDIKPYKAEKKEVWSRKCPCGNAFIPDTYDICDSCLLEHYRLEPHHDQCDQIGLGPRSIDEDMVIAALRYARSAR